MNGNTTAWGWFDSINQAISGVAQTAINYKTAVAQINQAGQPTPQQQAVQFVKDNSGMMMLAVGGLVLFLVMRK